MCGEGAEFLEWNIGEVGWVYVGMWQVWGQVIGFRIKIYGPGICL